jgi:hypothetical protein
MNGMHISKLEAWGRCRLLIGTHQVQHKYHGKTMNSIHCLIATTHGRYPNVSNPRGVMQKNALFTSTRTDSLVGLQ